MTSLLAHRREPKLMLLCRTAAQTLRVDHAQVNLLENLEQTHVATWPADGVDDPPIPVTESGCQTVLRVQRPVRIRDLREHPITCDLPVVKDGVVLTYMGVPIWQAGCVVGALCVFGSAPRRWTRREVKVLRRLGRVAGLSVGGPRKRSALSPSEAPGAR